jgi:hypothetical protein
VAHSLTGLGPIGLLVCQWAKNVFGARRIIGIDSVPERLSTANKLFGVEPLNFAEHKDVVGRILELESRGLDVSVDCAAFRYAKTPGQKAARTAGVGTSVLPLPSDRSNVILIASLPHHDDTRDRHVRPSQRMYPCDAKVRHGRNDCRLSCKRIWTSRAFPRNDRIFCQGYTNHFHLGGLMEKGKSASHSCRHLSLISCLNPRNPFYRLLAESGPKICKGK